MPPLDKPKSDPLVVLLDEIELLSAQTRLMELYLKRAHTAAFGEVEKIQEQFRTKVTNLKARLEDKENSLTKHLSYFGSDPDQLNTANQELLQRITEQQNLLQRRQEAFEQRGAEIAMLQDRLSHLEATKLELENSAALRLDQTQQELKLQVARLQSELTQKEQILQQRDASAKQMAQEAEVRIRGLAEELASSRETVEQLKAQMLGAESEREELRQRFSQLESASGELQAQGRRDLDALRQDAQAKIAALQSEIAHKTALLTRNQTAIAELERDLKARSETSRSEAQLALLENQTAELARREGEIAVLSRRVADLENAAQEQQHASASELSQARETFAAELAALRSELAEKQQLLEQGRGDSQHIEQELRNRNRELQGKLAAKEAVVESMEHNLRQAQMDLLAARDALGASERSLRDCQQQLTEKEQLIESRRNEIDQTKSDLAAAIERVRQTNAERSAVQERAQELTAQVGALTDQLNEKEASLASQSETLRQAEARLAALCAALGSARDELEEQQLKARRTEQDFAARLLEFQGELERKDQAFREQQATANREDPALRAQIDDLESRLREKERLLEARAREIGVLQARVESLSGQTARLEATHRQALEDAGSDSHRARQALEAEIAAMRSEREGQNTLLEKRQAALAAIEQTLRAEIEAAKQHAVQRQSLLDKQNAELQQADAEMSTLRARIAQLEGASAQMGAAPVPDPSRIAALEDQFHSREQGLAELQAALQHSEREVQSVTGEARLKLVEDQRASDQSKQLRAAQERINELLERLAELEAARHTLQENASHELQQLRESFESRIAKLRKELAEKEQTPAKDPSLEDQQSMMKRPEGDYQRQIQELRGQLAAKHSLLDNRNEELIKVKAEMDSLQDYVARLQTGRDKEGIDAPLAVELREEDAVEMPPGFVNGSPRRSISRPNPLQFPEAEPEAGMDMGNDATDAEKSNRFTHLEGRVRSWSPEPEKGSALGTNRRWSMGIFKRRWRA